MKENYKETGEMLDPGVLVDELWENALEAHALSIAEGAIEIDKAMLDRKSSGGTWKGTLCTNQCKPQIKRLHRLLHRLPDARTFVTFWLK